ncbi:MAG: DoxX family protein [Crocinitomicaceae bacterium]
MNTTIWTLQIVVAIALTTSALIILLGNKEKLSSRMSWISHYSDKMRYFICTSKILGGLGLILPMAFSILPLLTPIAGFAIALFMLFAMTYHVRKKEYKEIPATIIFFGISFFIAVYRLHTLGYCMHN